MALPGALDPGLALPAVILECRKRRELHKGWPEKQSMPRPFDDPRGSQSCIRVAYNVQWQAHVGRFAGQDPHQSPI